MHLALAHVVPRPTVSRFFEDASLATPVDHEPLHVTWLPDGRTKLIFRVLEGEEHAALWIAGPRSRALFKVAPGVGWAVTVPFRPGWSAPLLGGASHELTDQVIPIEDLWGRAARDLGQELVARPSVQDVALTLAHLFGAHARVAAESSADRLARSAVRLLEGNAVRVSQVANHLGVTPRHLRRAFRESVGVGPKEFARAVRLQRAVRRAAAVTVPDWREIAADAGYYDQAHLIGDFRELVGLTPGAYFDARVARPLSKVCLPS